MDPFFWPSSVHSIMRDYILLQEGDIIKVTKKNENGMWEGELNNRRGHFPFKLVEVVDNH